MKKSPIKSKTLKTKMTHNGIRAHPTGLLETPTVLKTMDRKLTQNIRTHGVMMKVHRNGLDGHKKTISVMGLDGHKVTTPAIILTSHQKTTSAMDPESHQKTM